MSQPQILSAGSVLWDTIGRAKIAMQAGDDIAGLITQIPGGVALNIAMALAKEGLAVDLLSHVGQDQKGDALIVACQERGLGTDFIYRSAHMPTDHYMAIEAPDGVLAAIADAHSLEKAGRQIFAPLEDGTLGDAQSPFSGIIVIDGNLTTGLLTTITSEPSFLNADLRIAPASPGKADRLTAHIHHPRSTIYVNLREASTLLSKPQKSAAEAAEGLVRHGCRKALVTDGPKEAALAFQDGVVTALPFEVEVKRLTGAGDVFMASHIAAEIRGLNEEASLQAAIERAAAFISSEEPL